jgi:hypothetical protein
LGPGSIPVTGGRPDDVTSDAIGVLTVVSSNSSQDYLTRHLLMSLPISECQYSENFLRTAVFSPESSTNVK